MLDNERSVEKNKGEGEVGWGSRKSNLEVRDDKIRDTELGQLWRSWGGQRMLAWGGACKGDFVTFDR